MNFWKPSCVHFIWNPVIYHKQIDKHFISAFRINLWSLIFVWTGSIYLTDKNRSVWEPPQIGLILTPGTRCLFDVMNVVSMRSSLFELLEMFSNFKKFSIRNHLVVNQRQFFFGNFRSLPKSSPKRFSLVTKFRNLAKCTLL